MAKNRNLGSGIERMLNEAEEVAVRNDQVQATPEPETALNMKIPQSLHKALKIYAVQQNMTVKDLAIKIFKEAIRK